MLAGFEQKSTYVPFRQDPNMGKNTLRKAFQRFDKDKDGMISGSELISVLCNKKGKSPFTEKEALAVVKKFDTDGDGQLNFEEFVSAHVPKRVMKQAQKQASAAATAAATAPVTAPATAVATAPSGGESYHAMSSTEAQAAAAAESPRVLSAKESTKGSSSGKSKVSKPLSDPTVRTTFTSNAEELEYRKSIRENLPTASMKQEWMVYQK